MPASVKPSVRVGVLDCLSTGALLSELRNRASDVPNTLLVQNEAGEQSEAIVTDALCVGEGRFLVSFDGDVYQRLNMLVLEADKPKEKP